MQKTIEALRTLILKKANLVAADVDEHEFAQHPGRGDRADDPKNDMKTWESFLWKKNNVSIILSFNQSNLNKDFDLQSIKFQGYPFRTIRLFIYDDNPRPAVVKITPQALVDKLSGRPSLQKKNTSYCIEPSAGKEEFAPTQSGHALNLYIKNTGKDWSIPNPNQLEKASAELVEKIVATVKDLLPVAEYYADNREDLLSGKI